MKEKGANVLFLEAFYGGSHKEFADGLVNTSRHNIELATLPHRYWKWRLKGAAYHFAADYDISAYDCIFTTSMLNAAELKACTGKRCPPVLMYMHENQLSYPRPKNAKRDFHMEAIQVASCLASDKILFNSYYHRSEFLTQLKSYIAEYPEFAPEWILEAVQQKSAVLHPGLDLPQLQRHDSVSREKRSPLIIWNHRWEFDKQPQIFFSSLKKLKEQHIAFQLALLGENSMVVPKEFLKAKKTFSKELVHYGYAASKDDYLNILKSGDIIVSTAIQENFGIAVMEAIHYGLFPLLPNRLSYPELIPEEYHSTVLYDSRKNLYERLTSICKREWNNNEALDMRHKLSNLASKFNWAKMIDHYDAEIEMLITGDV